MDHVLRRARSFDPPPSPKPRRRKSSFAFLRRSSPRNTLDSNDEDPVPPVPPTPTLLPSLPALAPDLSAMDIDFDNNSNNGKNDNNKNKNSSSPKRISSSLLSSSSSSTSASSITTTSSVASHHPLPNESPEQYLSRLSQIVPRSEVARMLSIYPSPFYSKTLNLCLEYRFNFTNDPLDIALRKLLMHFLLPQETQQIDRLLLAFSCKYHNDNPSLFPSSDHPYILAFSLIMLHTDVFNPSNKSKMSKHDYIKNTCIEGVPIDILPCFYDNTVFSPFIFVEEENSSSPCSNNDLGQSQSSSTHTTRQPSYDSSSRNASISTRSNTTTSPPASSVSSIFPSPQRSTSSSLFTSISSPSSSSTTQTTTAPVLQSSSSSNITKTTTNHLQHSNNSSNTHLHNKTKLDPYYLIANHLIHELRAEVDLHVPQKNPFSFTGTIPFFNATLLHEQFLSSPLLPVSKQGRNNKPPSDVIFSPVNNPTAITENTSTANDTITNDNLNSINSPNNLLQPHSSLQPFPSINVSSSSSSTTTNLTLTTSSSSATPSVSHLRVCKVGILLKKDNLSEGGKKISSRKWKNLSVILTHTQLLFYRDASLAPKLQEQITSARSSHSTSPTKIINSNTNVDLLNRPETVITLTNCVAIYDWTYTKKAHAFTLLMSSGREYLVQAIDETEMNDWIACINWAASFKACGFKIISANPSNSTAMAVPSGAGIEGEVRNKGERRSTISHPEKKEKGKDSNAGDRKIWDDDYVFPPTSSKLVAGQLDESPSSTSPSTLNASPTNLSPPLTSAMPSTPSSLSSSPKEKSTHTFSSSKPSSPVKEFPTRKKFDESTNARIHQLRAKIQALEQQITTNKETLHRDIRLAKNLAVLTPFQTSTREKIQSAVKGDVSKRVIKIRKDLCRLLCFREVMLRSLLMEIANQKKMIMAATSASLGVGPGGRKRLSSSPPVTTNTGNARSTLDGDKRRPITGIDHVIDEIGLKLPTSIPSSSTDGDEAGKEANNHDTDEKENDGEYFERAMMLSQSVDNLLEVHKDDQRQQQETAKKIDDGKESDAKEDIVEIVANKAMLRKRSNTDAPTPSTSSSLLMPLSTSTGSMAPPMAPPTLRLMIPNDGDKKVNQESDNGDIDSDTEFHPTAEEEDGEALNGDNVSDDEEEEEDEEEEDDDEEDSYDPGILGNERLKITIPQTHSIPRKEPPSSDTLTTASTMKTIVLGASSYRNEENSKDVDANFDDADEDNDEDDDLAVSAKGWKERSWLNLNDDLNDDDDDDDDQDNLTTTTTIPIIDATGTTTNATISTMNYSSSSSSSNISLHTANDESLSSDGIAGNSGNFSTSMSTSNSTSSSSSLMPSPVSAHSLAPYSTPPPVPPKNSPPPQPPSYQPPPPPSPTRSTPSPQQPKLEIHHSWQPSPSSLSPSKSKEMKKSSLVINVNGKNSEDCIDLGSVEEEAEDWRRTKAAKRVSLVTIGNKPDQHHQNHNHHRKHSSTGAETANSSLTVTSSSSSTSTLTSTSTPSTTTISATKKLSASFSRIRDAFMMAQSSSSSSSSSNNKHNPFP